MSSRSKVAVYKNIKIFLGISILSLAFLVPAALPLIFPDISDGLHRIITVALPIAYIGALIFFAFKRNKVNTIDTVTGPLVVVAEVDSRPDYVTALPASETRAKIYYGTFAEKWPQEIDIYEINGQPPEKWQSASQRGIWLSPGKNVCLIRYRTGENWTYSNSTNPRFEVTIAVESGQQYEIYFSNEKKHLVVLRLL
jgi:hypothetical protein